MEAMRWRGVERGFVEALVRSSKEREETGCEGSGCFQVG